MNYDYLKLKYYDYRVENKDGLLDMYVLSFNERQHIKVSEVAKKIMDCFDGTRTIGQIHSELNNKNIICSCDDLIKFVDDILFANSIIEGMNYATKTKSKSSSLWCHIPVIDCNKISWLFKLLGVFYVKYVYIIVLNLIILCCGFSINKVIIGGINLYDVNSLRIILLVVFSLILHEFGHITAAYKQKISVGYIGIGMYLFNPVMYVDITSAWRLDSRGRVLVDIGGMYFQLITIVPLTIIGVVFQTNAFYLINISIIGMTIMNLIPFIKLDGYWILCDYLGLDNLSSNAFGIVINIVKALLGNKEDKNGLVLECKKQRKVYTIFAFVYTISTLLMIALGIILAVNVLGNLNVVKSNILEVYISIKTNNINSGLTILNQTFILILPLLFLVFMIIQIVVNITKKLMNRVKTSETM